MAIDCGAGYMGCYIGSIFVENTCFEGQAEGKKTKNICSGQGWRAGMAAGTAAAGRGGAGGGYGAE